MLKLLFWLSYIVWSLLPDTKTPRFELESIVFNIKDIVNIAIACLYLCWIANKNSPLKTYRKRWDYYLPTLTFMMLIYAGVSIEWNHLNKTDTLAMIYTLFFTGSAFLLGYFLIAKMDCQSIHSFLWKLTICIAAIGLLYSAESFFSLGLATEIPYESMEFGIQRVRGPLFGSTTGGFILLPALGFSIDQIILNRNYAWFKLSVIFSLLLTIIGLGSRSALIILGIFFILSIFSIKNNKQKRTVFLTILVITSLAAFLFYSKAKTDRLQSVEDQSRSDTYTTSFNIIKQRSIDDINTLFFGSGYGSYWPWYLTDMNTSKEILQSNMLVVTPQGFILYHPHSTFLLFIVELGIPGLIYFVALWIILFGLLLQNTHKTTTPILNCGIFASALSMFFDFFIFKSPQVNTIWWIFLFAALALNKKINILGQHSFKKISKLS